MKKYDIKKLKLKVCEGRLIRNPRTGDRLKPNMAYTVPATLYWLRRVKQGDCQLIDKADDKPKLALDSVKPKAKGSDKKQDNEKMGE